MTLLPSFITWALCNQAISTLAFAPHGITRFKNAAPSFVRNLDRVHAIISDREGPSPTSPRRNFISQYMKIALNAVILQTVVMKPCLADIEGVVTTSFADPTPVASSPKELIDNELVPISSVSSSQSTNVILYTSKSGLKYIDLQEGMGVTPRYGQLCSISYDAYIKLPDSSNGKEKPQQYDSSDAYLLKHGNGRIIPGLDEGIHTMKVGGKRRLIIPPKMGYIGPGVLGPLPPTPIGRYQLNRLLEEMIARRGGNIVVDVNLRAVFDDEADQGYYDDDSLRPDDFNTLRTNLQRKVAAARGIPQGDAGSAL